MEWIPISEPLLLNTGILVTNGKMITCCEIEVQRNGDLWMKGHNFGGHDWDFFFDIREITHFSLLPELPPSKLWIPITEKPLPIEVGILVTDGKKITCCEIEDDGNGNFMNGHNFDGYEWDFNFEANQISHFMPLLGLPSLNTKFFINR